MNFFEKVFENILFNLCWNHSDNDYWYSMGVTFVLMTSTHCSTLQHTATNINTATYCNKHQHTATYCDTLQHTATQEHTATYCNMLQHRYSNYDYGYLMGGIFVLMTSSHCNTLQHTATHCNTGIIQITTFVI